MTLNEWVAAHPFLQRIAHLHARIENATKAVAVPPLSFPAWEDYREDFVAGVPLLSSASARLDVSPVDTAVPLVIDLLGRDEEGRSGLRHYVRCVMLSSALQPIVRAFAEWRDDERWMRPSCPTCGSPPAMAQLVGVDPGRQRLLSCVHCATRWRYARTTCPFCEVQSHRLSALAIEGQGGLRIDYCEACRAYLKTYNGQGDERVMLADWTSLHLDALAQDRGLVRRGASLYDLEAQTA